MKSFENWLKARELQEANAKLNAIGDPRYGTQSPIQQPMLQPSLRPPQPAAPGQPPVMQQQPVTQQPLQQKKLPDNLSIGQKIDTYAKALQQKFQNNPFDPSVQTAIEKNARDFGQQYGQQYADAWRKKADFIVKNMQKQQQAMG